MYIWSGGSCELKGDIWQRGEGMVNDPISADLREFILRHIDLVAHLEALLLLRAPTGLLGHRNNCPAALFH